MLQGGQLWDRVGHEGFRLDLVTLGAFEVR